MAGSHTLTFTDTDFDAEVLQSDQPVLVDFWAIWCGPCRQMAPVIDSVAQKYADKIKVGKLDVDHNPQAAQRFNVRGIPTMLLFKSGRPVEQIVGLVPESRLADVLESHVAWTVPPRSPARTRGRAESAGWPRCGPQTDSRIAVTQFPLTSRRAFLRTGGLSACAVACAAGASANETGSPDPAPNVLLVLVDDLRTELGCYGSARVRTPNIDRIAKGGLTFLRSYCQQAASGPSRTALLTGLRPDTTRVYDGRTHFRRAVPGAVTLPEHFRRHGYETTAFGTIFESPAMDDLPSWSIAPWTPDSPAWRS